MTLGQLVDKRYKLRTQRLALMDKVKVIKEEENQIDSEIFKEFGKQKISQARGRTALGSVKKEVVPNLKSWDDFIKYAKRKGNDDLIARRVSATAWRARLESGVLVPGTESFTRISLSITRNS